MLRLADCPKSPGELERAAALSNNNRARRRVRRAREDFCGGKSHFPEQKSLPCSFCARKSERFQQKLVGVAVAGELAPSSTSSLAFRAVYRLKGAFKARRALSAAFMSGAVPCVCVKEFLIGVGLRRARRGAAVLDVLNQLIGQLLYYVGVLAYQVAALGYVGAQVV